MYADRERGSHGNVFDYVATKIQDRNNNNNNNNNKSDLEVSDLFNTPILS